MIWELEQSFSARPPGKSSKTLPIYFCGFNYCKKMGRGYITFLIVILAGSMFQVEAAKILGLFAFPGKSHFMVFKAIMKELTERGHEVTVVSNFRLQEIVKNYTQLVIEPPYDYWKDVKDTIKDIRDMSTVEIFDLMNLIGEKTTDYALNSPVVKELIHEKKEKFDLIIVEQFYQDAMLIIPYVYGAPVIAVATSSFENHMSTMMGLIVPWAQSPQDFLPYSDRMSFFERLTNCYCSLYSEYNRRFKYFPQQDSLVKKYFSHVQGNLPSVSELEKNVSLLLVNNFMPLDISRPSVMNMVAVGGIHVSPPKELPWDIRDFLDDARRGAIYFSLGTNVKSTDLPKDVIATLLKVFSGLKERVLWKWDDVKIPDLPKNVMLRKWVPQSDVLAHPHVKFFITHGGILSIQEAVYRNVPILGIPFFGDQHINLRKATDLGIGLMLDAKNLTEKSLLWALKQLFSDPSYIANMRATTNLFRDRPSSPMDTAMYWIEYVIRHKGAPHLKTAAVYIPWYSLYLVDILLFAFGCGLGVIGVVYLLVRLVFYIKNRKKAKVYEKLR